MLRIILNECSEQKWMNTQNKHENWEQFLPSAPATKLRQGNVFTPVYDSVHRREGICQGDPPLDRDPPRTEFLTHACENITFPQLLLRHGNESYKQRELKLFLCIMQVQRTIQRINKI